MLPLKFDHLTFRRSTEHSKDILLKCYHLLYSFDHLKKVSFNILYRVYEKLPVWKIDKEARHQIVSYYRTSWLFLLLYNVTRIELNLKIMNINLIKKFLSILYFWAYYVTFLNTVATIKHLQAANQFFAIGKLYIQFVVSQFWNP